MSNNNLKEKYQKEIAPQLTKEFGLGNSLAAPKLKKIVVNIGLSEALDNKKALEAASEDLAMITGQRPKTTRARQSIAGFKLRKGQSIGLMVTLRGRRMYDFLEKLISVVLPRLRDFQGVSLKSFDGQGNYSLGIPEQIVFSEIDHSKVDKVRGLEMTIVTNARTNEKAKRLLELLGMPFEKGEK
ncbi:50S ribosomal protein L5 [Microgenomates group bacterium RBG_19FT_COMBO_39_10]|nr:ribosomal protein L5 [uncultured bacterium]OGV89203.1 MAG: 50S ribosomal protein L5 [Microgenomates group bacterium RBG_19FT_COMBO_39_10]